MAISSEQVSVELCGAIGVPAEQTSAVKDLMIAYFQSKGYSIMVGEPVVQKKSLSERWKECTTEQVTYWKGIGKTIQALPGKQQPTGWNAFTMFGGDQSLVKVGTDGFVTRPTKK